MLRGIDLKSITKNEVSGDILFKVTKIFLIDLIKTKFRFKIHGDKLKKILPIVNEMIKYEPLEKRADDYVCLSMKHSFGIEASGNVNPCNTMFYSLGNIREDSLKEIWYSDKARKIRNIKYADIGKKCQNCSVSSFCIRCSGVALNECGDMFGSLAYSCELASIRAEL